MNRQKKTYQLSVFLVKNLHASAGEIVKCDACEPPVTIDIPGLGLGELFLKRSPAEPPRWTELFHGYINPASLEVPGVSAAFLVTVNARSFVLTFGQGGRFLLKDDVCEERFGLLCALNSVDPKTFRSVDVQSLDAIQSRSRIQSGQETTPDQFGLDVEQDMLKAIVGAPLNPAFGSRMTGSDSLSVSVRMDLSDLAFLLDQYRSAFEVDLSAEDHQWVNNISITKSSATIARLEEALNAKLSGNTFDDVWLAIPEIIEWATVKGFIYTSGRGEVHPDIKLQGFLRTVADGVPLTLELMRKRKVSCADADHKIVYKSWSVFKCLYAELDLDGRKYILNDGTWFSVASNFVAKTNADFARIPRSKLKLPEYDGGTEGSYNAAVADGAPEMFALLDDKKKVMHGGGQGQIEICDLFSTNRELIHVKKYGKSSVISHLVSQGFVSGQLIQIDADFRRKVRAQLPTRFAKLIPISEKPADGTFTIVYAVISDKKTNVLHLPFFSRVNLNNAAKILRGFGYKVELLKIGVDDAFSKTTKLPPGKKRNS